MRCSYYPQSLVQNRGAIREIGSWIWGSWPADAVHPESFGHIGLTGASHRSDRCRLLVEFCSGERLDEFPVVLCCCCFEFGSFWSSVGLFGGFGISWLGPVWTACYTGLTCVWAFCGSSQILPVGTSLTGAAHRPDRCSPVVLELLVLLRSRVGGGGCWFLGQ
jgi:hypothetical protein